MQAHALGASSSAAGVTSSVGAAGAAALLLRPRPSQMRRHRTVFTAAAAEGAGPSGEKPFLLLSLFLSLSRALHCMQTKAYQLHTLSVQTIGIPCRAAGNKTWFFPENEEHSLMTCQCILLSSLSRSFSPLASAENRAGQSSESQQQQPPLPPLRPPLKKASGLARTPSGGLAAGGALTSTDLPPPAVAVRNLIELAQYAHLASNMSQMHHR